MIRVFSKKAGRFLSVGLLLGAFMTCVCCMDVKSDAQTLLEGKTASEISDMMGKGWNLGNSLDATGGKSSDIYSCETSWGNPKICKECIDGVAKAGFKTIRIPITWAKHVSKDENHTIDPEFLAHVKEVVDWAYDNDLFVIINVHHEGWLNCAEITTDTEAIGEKLSDIWAQVADYFCDYDQHLIFEGLNEPRAAGTSYEWNGNQDGYDAVNYLDEVFVKAVRSCHKGRNDDRIITIPGYAASNSAVALRAIKIPEIDGKPVDNIMISVHCYSPYEFCLTDNKDTFSATNPSDTSDIRRMMKDIKSLFLDNGIPAYIGECGCTNTKDNLQARIEWFNFFGSITSEYNVPAIVWDNGSSGSSGGECHRYISRKTGDNVAPELTAAFINGYDPDKQAEDILIDFEPLKVNGTTEIKTPKDLGFEPTSLTAKAKINHTPEAPVGFSLCVDSKGANSEAALDISRFEGKALKVSAFVLNENSEVAVYCDDVFMARLSRAADWQEVMFAVSGNVEALSRIRFVGDNEETFYLDDISINIIGEEEVASINQLLEPEILDGDGMIAPPSKKTGLVMAICVGAAVLLILAAAFFIRRK